MNAARTLQTLAWVLGAVLGASMAATAGAQPAAPAQQQVVYTRARLVSVLQEPAAEGKLYVRLQLIPNAKLPFTTQAFRVLDRSLIEGLPDGAWVRFTAQRVDGENTLTAIHLAEACKRFEPCH